MRYLGDGRWWDEVRQTWRDGRGRAIPSPAPAEQQPVRTTKVVLAAAHFDHDPGHCGRRHRNIRALCQRCHLLHDRPEHRVEHDGLGVERLSEESKGAPGSRLSAAMVAPANIATESTTCRRATRRTTGWRTYCCFLRPRQAAARSDEALGDQQHDG
jgi:hypothetical protein